MMGVTHNMLAIVDSQTKVKSWASTVKNGRYKTGCAMEL